MNESKSGDSSLRDWFSKSRSSDGTPGWVQLGGKYAGKPCAKQPGQTTKPKCGSSKMKRNLNKDEEQAAFRRKNRQDPNPERKGKAINVKTEEVKKDHEYEMARRQLATVNNASKRLKKKMGKKGEGELKAWVQSKITKAADYIDTAADYMTNEAAGEKDACYKKVKSRYSVWPSAYASGALVKCRKVGAANWGNKTKKEDYDYSDWRNDFKALEIETIDLILPDPLLKEGHKSCPKGEYYCYDSKKCKPIPKGYHVMGNGQLMKDEDHEDSEEKNGNGNGGDVSEAKKCWKGYKKVGTQKLFGKTYNRCEKEGYEPGDVDKKVGAVTAIPKDERDAAKERIRAKTEKKRKEREMNEATKKAETEFHTKLDSLVHKTFGSSPEEKKKKKEREMNEAKCTVKPKKVSDIIKMQLKTQSEQPLTQNQREFNIARVHPANEELSNWRNDIEEGAAWTKKSGKSESGGLNEKGRKSYERENPGSDLKAPSKKVGNPRRKSFCARMKGMKKKLTSSKTANDPDSRINKSLRAWNC